jgi:hypothetical protein
LYWQLEWDFETPTQESDSDVESDTSEGETSESFSFCGVDYDDDDSSVQFEFDDASFLQERDIEKHALADLKALPKASPLVTAQKIKLQVSEDFQEKARSYYQKTEQLKKRKRGMEASPSPAPGVSPHDWNLTPRPFKEVGTSASAMSNSLWNWGDASSSAAPPSALVDAAPAEHQQNRQKKKKRKTKCATSSSSAETGLKAALTAAETIQQLGKDAADKPPATLQPNSMYKGVSRGKREGTWQAKLTLTTKEGKKRRWNGTFEDQRSAAEAYDTYIRNAVEDGHQPGNMRASQRWRKMKKDAAKRKARGLSFETMSVDYEYQPEVNFPRPGSRERQATRQKRWGRTVTAPKEWGRIDPSKLSGREQSWKATRADGTLVGHYESELKALEELEHDFEQRKEQHALLLKEREGF